MYILLGIVPEVLFFLSFIVLAKGFKKDFKLLVAFVIMLAFYIGLKTIYVRSIYFYLSYIFACMISLRVLYKSRIKITDVFLFSFASILLIILTALAYYTIPNYFIAMIVSRILMLATILFFKNKIRNYYLKYKLCWNRNKENPNKIKSLTLRNISAISFNVMIFILDLILHST